MASLSIYIGVYCLTICRVVVFMGCVPQQWQDSNPQSEVVYYEQQQYNTDPGFPVQQDFGSVFYIEQRLQSLLIEVDQIKEKVYARLNQSALFHMDSERYRLYQIKEEIERYRAQGLSEKIVGTVWYLENKIGSVMKQLNNYFVKVIKELIEDLEPFKGEFRVSKEAQSKLSFIQDKLKDLINKIENAASYDDIHKAKYLYQVITNEFEDVKNTPKVGLFKGVTNKIGEIYKKFKSIF